MQLSLPTKAQLVNLVKVALYIGVSASLDYLISQTTGSEFGILTGPINLALVGLKSLLTKGQ